MPSVPEDKEVTSRAMRIREHLGRWQLSQTSYNQRWELEDLQKGIMALKDALAELSGLASLQILRTFAFIQNSLPSNICTLEGLQSELAVSLRDRHTHTDSLEDIKDMIRLLREASSNAEPHSHIAIFAECRLGAAEFTLFNVTSDVQHLENATRMLNSLLLRCPPNHSLRPDVMHELAKVLMRRYMHLGSVDDLSRTLTLLEEALATRPPSELLITWVKHTLASALRLRYARSGRTTDLDLALQHQQWILTHLPEQHRDYHLIEGSIGVTLIQLHDKTNATEQLHLGVAMLRSSLARLAARSSQADLVTVTLNLAGALGTLAATESHPELLQEAIDLLRPLVSIAHPASPWVCTQLAWLLCGSYESSNNDRDLDESIQLHRKLSFQPASNAERQLRLMNFGNALLARYWARNNLDDCNEGVGMYRAALDLEPLSDVANDLRIHLAGSLKTLWTRSANRAQMQEAVNLCDEWRVHRSSDDGGATAGALAEHFSIAAEIYVKQYDLSGNLAYLDTSINLWEKTCVLEAHSNPSYQHGAPGLSRALRKRFAAQHVLSDLHRAQALLEDTTQRTNLNNAARSLLYFELAELYLTPGTILTSILTALDALMNALALKSQPIHQCIEKATGLIFSLEKMIDDHADQSLKERFLHACTAVIQMLPRVAYLGLDASSQLRALSGASDHLPVLAAMHAVERRAIEHSVELLEQGHAVFWQQHLRLRTPIDNLPLDLGQRLSRGMSMLERGRHASTATVAGDEQEAKIAQERMDATMRNLGSEVEALVTEIRRHEGFDRFLLPDTFSFLSTAASDYPVVILLAGNAKTCAVILRGPNEVQSLDLNGLSAKELEQCSKDITRESQHRSTLARQRVCKVLESKHKSRSLDRALDVLWRSVISELAKALNWKVHNHLRC